MSKSIEDILVCIHDEPGQDEHTKLGRHIDRGKLKRMSDSKTTLSPRHHDARRSDATSAANSKSYTLSRPKRQALSCSSGSWISGCPAR
jgi:hypothetical protein